MSRSEFDAFVGKHSAYDTMLRENGHGILSQGLQSVQTATTVRVRAVARCTPPTAHSRRRRSSWAGFFIINAGTST